RPTRAEDREPMVLTGDLGAPGGQVLDRVIRAVVPEWQLVGLKTDRPAQELVAQTDAVHGPSPDELADGLDDVVERGWVARSVGQEDCLGLTGEQLLRARPAGMELHRGAAGPKVAQDRELDPCVDHRHSGPR